ncbi:hypothetical protein J5Y09_21580 [Roseomonas sp. PWR1]|uniref:Lipoprotein n=1 Tax=Roseomonas nitratireducens TaxID=2820810 RepID=A0ABS4AYS6_9PROT|nr:hypothetical protein [Neoroseomonas nitratireducens]MBP0466535.1 hypothetical protein [Neoroseomonas nitratireducens]
MVRTTVAGFAILGLSACVPVGDGSYQQPYGTYAGNAGFTAPYAYPRGYTPYVYRQSQGSWPRGYPPPGHGNERNRHNRPGHDNRRNF